MTFLQLEYFRAVARAENITHVAATLNVSSAALSKTIRQLEREVGYPLFNREGRRIILNKRGLVFLEYVEDILDSMDTARSLLAKVSRQNERFLRVRFDVQLGEPGVLAVELKKLRPELTVVAVGTLQGRSHYDLRFFATQGVSNGAGCDLICEERMMAAIPAGHPLSGCASVRLDEMREEPFAISRQDGHNDLVVSMCGDAGFAPKVGMLFGAESYGGIRQYLCEGLGCSIVPERVWKSEWATDQVVLVPLSDVVRIRRIYCARPPASSLSNDAYCLIDFVKRRLNPTGSELIG